MWGLGKLRLIPPEHRGKHPLVRASAILTVTGFPVFCTGTMSGTFIMRGGGGFLKRRRVIMAS